MLSVEELSGNSDSTLDWHRLVTAFPDLRTDLSGIVLRGMDLEFFDLSDVVLANADLSCSNLGHANLSNAILTKVKFVGAELGGTKLDRALSTAADFSDARLNGASLKNTWLADANFNMAYLWKTSFADYENKYPPKSAERAYVEDLYDSNESGGAERFELWARENGATTQTNYDAWQQSIARDIQAGRITRHCN